MLRIIYLKVDMFCIILDIIPEGGFIFHFIYLINLIGQKWRIQNLPISPRDFSFWNFPHRTHKKCLCQIMVEDAGGLDYIKDKVTKRAEEIIIHAECETSVQIAWTLGTLGIERLWTLTCTVSKAFCL